MQQNQGVSALGRGLGYIAALFAFALTWGFASLAPDVIAGTPQLWDWAWAPSLGIGFSFLLDGLSLIFALLISGIGGLIFLYATGYMGEHPQFARFTLYLFSFMLSMLGLVLARDLITLFLFWELTSITSYLLIGFDHQDERARRNALQAMLVTAAGGLALLAGFILIGFASGSNDLAVILSGDSLRESALYGPILGLVLIGAFTKSAQFPFHFWLPNAMAAPTPVSAYLHSATMVKAGVYLLARLHPVLADTTAWVTLLTTAGLITTVMASIFALRQTDLKQALAYTTLMALGMITLLLAGSHPYALTAAVTFLIVHSLYKATLFMVVGSIDHGTGTRELALMGGLGRKMPVTAFAAILAAASMAGLPLFIGWIGKELIYAGAQQMVLWPIVLLGALAANGLMVAVAGIVALKPFFGEARETPHHPHESPWEMLVGPALLATLGLVFGLFATPLLGPIITEAVTGSLQAERAGALHIWGGFNLPLLMSLLTFALGAALFLKHDLLRAKITETLAKLPGFDTGWDRFLDQFRAFAAWQTRLIQTGRLSHYLFATFLVLALTLSLTILFKLPAIRPQFDASLLVWLIAAFTLAGACVGLTTESRIAVIAGIGTVGIGVALIFITFGAPDVATTQLMVETLSAVLFGIACLKLPPISERRNRQQRRIHAVVAIVIGVCVTLIVLAIASHPLDRHITTYYEQSAYYLAHGRNIVNVILVDFRAFDTFGELIVVLLAAIGGYAVIKRRVRAPLPLIRRDRRPKPRPATLATETTPATGSAS